MRGDHGLAPALEAAGLDVTLAPEASQGALAEGPPRLVVFSEDVPDLVRQVRESRARWPLVDVLVHAADASARDVRALLQAGARDVLLETDTESVATAVRRALEAQQILPAVEELSKRRVRSSRFEGMLSRSNAMWDVFETCARVGPTDASVLICGETGTGKELLARAVHRRSGRSGRFVPLNCSAIPDHLVESELFGHEKGAFTGAVKESPGIFRRAQGGTVFLDEIGDMPQPAQQSLLRVVEQRVVRPVGSADEAPVDVRIVAATNKPLEEAVAAGTFREDLFYRLDVIRLQIPALRDRPEDIVYLFGFFAKRLAKHYGVAPPKIGDAFIGELTAYPWPGNVRELENLAERLTLRGESRALAASDFHRSVRPAGDGVGAAESSASTDRAPPCEIDTTKTLEQTVMPQLNEIEERYLAALLTETGGSVRETASRAGVSPRTLQRKMAALSLDKADFKSPGADD